MTKAQMEADLAAIIAAGPGTVTVEYSGQEVSGLKSRIEDSELAENAGLQKRYAFSVATVLSDWTTVPPEEELVTIGSDEWRVLRTATDGADVELRLDLGAKYSTGFTERRGWE